MLRSSRRFVRSLPRSTMNKRRGFCAACRRQGAGAGRCSQPQARRFNRRPRRGSQYGAWNLREVRRGAAWMADPRDRTQLRLSETQRVAFYELVTLSLRAADTLAGACHAGERAYPTRPSDADARATSSRASGDDSDPPRAHTVLLCFRPGTKGPVCGNALSALREL
jgi:hypothetical protein